MTYTRLINHKLLKATWSDPRLGSRWHDLPSLVTGNDFVNFLPHGQRVPARVHVGPLPACVRAIPDFLLLRYSFPPRRMKTINRRNLSSNKKEKERMDRMEVKATVSYETQYFLFRPRDGSEFLVGFRWSLKLFCSAFHACFSDPRFDFGDHYSYFHHRLHHYYYYYSN